jgi:hypothetical protein
MTVGHEGQVTAFENKHSRVCTETTSANRDKVVLQIYRMSWSSS